MERCERCMELLSLRLDGELTAEEEQWLSQHLEQCSDCREIAEQLERLHGAFTQLEDIPAPEGFAQGVMARIRAEEAVPSSQKQTKVIHMFRRPQARALAGLAACAVLCLGVYQAGLLNRLPGSQGNFQTASLDASSQVQQKGGQELLETEGEPEVTGAPRLQSSDEVQNEPDESTATSSDTVQSNQEPAVQPTQEPSSQSQKVQTPQNSDKQSEGTAQVGTGKAYGVTSQEQSASQSQSEGQGEVSVAGAVGGGEQPSTQTTVGAAQQTTDGTADDQPTEELPPEDQVGQTTGDPNTGVDVAEQPEQEPVSDSIQGDVPQGETYQVGEETVDAILTLTVLPQGAQEVLGEEISWQVNEEGDSWCLISGQQMEQLISLAQEEGQDLTHAATNRIEAEQRCALIVTEKN